MGQRRKPGQWRWGGSEPGAEPPPLLDCGVWAPPCLGWLQATLLMGARRLRRSTTMTPPSSRRSRSTSGARRGGGVCVCVCVYVGVWLGGVPAATHAPSPAPPPPPPPPPPPLQGGVHPPGGEVQVPGACHAHRHQPRLPLGAGGLILWCALPALGGRGGGGSTWWDAWCACGVGGGWVGASPGCLHGAHRHPPPPTSPPDPCCCAGLQPPGDGAGLPPAC